MLALRGGKPKTLLVPPTKPSDLTYVQITGLLRKHYSPPVSEIYKRFIFNKCNQKPDQSIADYIVELRKLASSCRFVQFLDDALRARSVCGIRSEQLQRQLLSDDKLSFKTACQKAQAAELAEKQVKDLASSTDNPINAVQSYSEKKYSKPPSTKLNSGICKNCGRTHGKDQCPAARWNCFECGKYGPARNRCMQKSSVGAVQGENSVNMSSEASVSESVVMNEDLYSVQINNVSAIMPAHKVSLLVEGSHVDFEVHTGACKFLMSESMYHKFLDNVNLWKVRYKLNTISGANIKVVGEGLVQVKCKNKEVKLPLIVVESRNEFTPLLGRNWLDILFPNWQHGFKVNNVYSLDKSFEVKFNVKDDAKPVVKKAYDMPYALKPKVEKKIKQMVQVGILKAVNYSEWASPIVVVPKKGWRCAHMYYYVHTVLRTQILELIHEDHIGIVRTKMLARSTLWWPNVNADIENMINGCQVCQQSQNNQERFLTFWPKTENVFSRIHIDFFHAEHKIFLLIVDSKSKWVDIHHMGKGTSIEPTIEKLKSTFSVMGLPDMIVSDNGPPFNSAEFTKFCHVNGIEMIKIPPYHPQSNGSAERHVQNVKDALNKYLLSKSTLKIEQRIVNFLFSYRNTPTTCGMSPNEIIFKVKPKTRLDLLKPKKGGQVDIKESEEFIRPPIFVVDEKVFVGKLGPYCKEKWNVGEIVKCVSAITYLVKVDDQVMYKHVNSLRKNMCNEHQLETVQLRSPCVDKTPSIDLFYNPNMTPEPQPEPSSSQVASPALAESVFQRQTNDVMPGAEVPCLRRSTRVRQAPKRLDL
nr:unnamed protein product [Callosobruchus analis]